MLLFFGQFCKTVLPKTKLWRTYRMANRPSCKNKSQSYHRLHQNTTTTTTKKIKHKLINAAKKPFVLTGRTAAKRRIDERSSSQRVTVLFSFSSVLGSVPYGFLYERLRRFSFDLRAPTLKVTGKVFESLLVSPQKSGFFRCSEWIEFSVWGRWSTCDW